MTRPVRISCLLVVVVLAGAAVNVLVALLSCAYLPRSIARLTATENKLLASGVERDGAAWDLSLQKCLSQSVLAVTYRGPAGSMASEGVLSWRHEAALQELVRLTRETDRTLWLAGESSVSQLEFGLPFRALCFREVVMETRTPSTAELGVHGRAHGGVLPPGSSIVALQGYEVGGIRDRWEIIPKNRPGRIWPATPMWSGLIAGTFFWAAVIALAPKTPQASRWLRAWARHRRNVCGICLYPLSGLPAGSRCPECGKGVANGGPPRTSAILPESCIAWIRVTWTSFRARVTPRRGPTVVLCLTLFLTTALTVVSVCVTWGVAVIAMMTSPQRMRNVASGLIDLPGENRPLEWTKGSARTHDSLFTRAWVGQAVVPNRAIDRSTDLSVLPSWSFASNESEVRAFLNDSGPYFQVLMKTEIVFGWPQRCARIAVLTGPMYPRFIPGGPYSPLRSIVVEGWEFASSRGGAFMSEEKILGRVLPTHILIVPFLWNVLFWSVPSLALALAWWLLRRPEACKGGHPASGSAES